jgi:hypothetical protein
MLNIGKVRRHEELVLYPGNVILVQYVSHAGVQTGDDDVRRFGHDLLVCGINVIAILVELEVYNPEAYLP